MHMVDMPPSVVASYKRFISMFPESFNQEDLERFYMFVNPLLANARKGRSTDWLRKNLRKDCAKLSDDDIERYCEIYRHIRDAKNVVKTHQARLIAQQEIELRMKKAMEKYAK